MGWLCTLCSTLLIVAVLCCSARFEYWAVRRKCMTSACAGPLVIWPSHLETDVQVIYPTQPHGLVEKACFNSGGNSTEP